MRKSINVETVTSAIINKERARMWSTKVTDLVQNYVASTTFQLVSTGGSCPWHSDAEKAEWSLQVVGFTWYDRKANITGLGRQPVATREEAQAIADTINGLRG